MLLNHQMCLGEGRVTLDSMTGSPWRLGSSLKEGLLSKSERWLAELDAPCSQDLQWESLVSVTARGIHAFFIANHNWESYWIHPTCCGQALACA